MEYKMNNGLQNLSDGGLEDRDMDMLQIQMTSEPDSSVESIVYQRHEPTTLCFRAMCMVCVILSGVVLVLALVVVSLSGNINAQTTAPSLPQALHAVQQDNQENALFERADRDTSDLRRAVENSRCPSQKCSICQTDVSSPVTRSQQYMHCPGNRAQTEALLAEHGCESTTYDWVLNNRESDDYLLCIDDYARCCMLSHVCPPGHCGEGECVCESHQSSMPVCKCPPHRKGSRCQEPADQQTIKCKCFNDGLQFCGEESLPDCSDTGRPVNWAQCHMGSTNRQNCVCEPYKDDNDTIETISRCITHASRTERDATNDSGQHHVPLVLMSIIITRQVIIS